MKKLSMLALVAVALTACGENASTPEDYKTIDTELQNLTSNGEPLMIVSLGSAGDYILQLPKTEAVKAVAKKDKTVKFLSAEIRPELLSADNCLVNIIPDRTMEQMGEARSNCNMALFCGTAEDLASGEVYAVELCRATEE